MKPYHKLKGLPSSFSRNKTPRFQYLAWRQSLLDHYIETYTYHDSYKEYDSDYREVTTYAKKGYLVSYVDEGYENSNIVMTILEKFKPKAILLGGLNNNNVDRYIDGFNMFTKPPLIYQGIEHLLARERMTKYFVREMPLKDQHFKLPKLNLIFEPNKYEHTLYFSDNLSAAYSACISISDKLLFAKPDNHLFLEDLVLRISVEELRAIFFDVIQTIIEDVEKKNLQWSHDVDSVYEVIYQTTKSKYAERLYEKMIVYNSSLLRTSLRLFGDSALLVDYYLANYVELTSNEPLLPEFDQIFRAYLDDNESKVRKFKHVKQMVKSLKDTIKNDKERLKIKQMLNDSDLNYNYRKKEMPLFESVSKMDADVIIEKYVILSHLITHDLRFYLEVGENPFKITIFKDVLAQKYPDTQSLRKKFMEINEKFKPVLHKVQNYFIKKIKDDDVGGRPDYLSMKDQEEVMRYRMGKGEMDYTIGFLNRIKQQQLITTLLYMQMQKIIKRKMSQGIPQNDILLHLKNIEQGNYTKNNLQTLLRLIAEANAELRLVKLPSYYKSTFPQIKDKLVSDLKSSLQKILDFVSAEQYMVYKDDKEREQKLRFFIMNQNIPLQNLEKLFQKKNPNDENEIDLDKHYTEYMDREEKKAYTIIYGPEGVKDPEIPEDLALKTTEEMEALGFKPMETVEFETDETGKIVNSDLTDEKREKIEKILKDVMSKPEKK